ncbi:CPBP family intramembrane glutamic endopeptidase [Peptoniphilus indolicus]|uniref:Abortive infection protein n=2 Tax=Peptoniphilus indolicus TaxID=33030 RepID=G4D504_9FIRM|nr:abortive infection protein [Peptoniphilus indolicus ATCC 29427]SUB74567.1 CAAX amino terminal protease self- immunity [Peptoniphilus indolicus]
MILDLIKDKNFTKNPYLYTLILLLMAKLVLFSSEIFTLGYINVVLNILPSSGYIINLVELSSFIFITLLVIFLARKILKISWNTLGFRKTGSLKEFLKGWGFGAIVLISCVAFMIIVGVVRIDKVTFDSKLILEFIPLLMVWSIQGNAEEVLTRGFLFSGVARKTNILIGIAVSAIFFTVMHLENDGISVIPLIDLFVFGIFAALVMIKTKNIWLVSGFHAAWNCFQGNVFAFPVSGTNVGNAFINVTTQGPSWLTGGKFGVEGSIISLIVQIVLIILLCYDLFVKQKMNVLDKFDIETYTDEVE